MSVEKDKETYVELAKQRGISDPERHLQEKYLATGKFSLPLVAIRAAIQDLAIERKVVPSVEGILLGRTHRSRGRERDQILLVPEKGTLIAVSVDEAPEVRTALDQTPRWSKVKITNVTEAYNATTDNRWHEGLETSMLTVEGRATFEDLLGRVIPPREIKGANGWFFTRGQKRFVNGAPAERFNPKAPKKQRAPGERIPELPVYDPANQRFVVVVDLRDGEESVKVKITDEHVFAGVVGAGQMKPFLEWLYRAETKNQDRLDNIGYLFNNTELFVVGRGGKTVHGAEVARPFLNVGEEGFLWTTEQLTADVNGNNGHAAAEGVGTSAPAPSEAPAPVTADAIVAYFQEHDGEVPIDQFSAMYEALGYKSPEAQRSATDTLKGLRKASRMIIQNDPARWVLVDAPQSKAA